MRRESTYSSEPKTVHKQLRHEHMRIGVAKGLSSIVLCKNWFMNPFFDHPHAEGIQYELGDLSTFLFNVG
ncbi:unnamed protein product [Protopolystoma xenopodis]|uniref:Uncharacterized protein n=1 Tax=Protopolystoma xenopodis TaxID=117903 RepID=A0A448XBF0_9PLAT|nr:unnamed protein product [Protopolystoma xenopodis]